MKTATKKPPTPGIEDQITELHEAIDELLRIHVDAMKAANPLIHRGVLEQLAIARADGTARCKCGVYRHLFGPKKP
jgi:hypothetical protein